jgi:hypothetical protein
MTKHIVHATISPMIFFLTSSLQNQQLEVTQPTPQEDEVDVHTHDVLEQESLQNLLALDHFLHMVFIFLFMHISMIENMKNSLCFVLHWSTW